MAAPIGQLPLCEERAVFKLKSGGLLGDVDIDRGPAEWGGRLSASLASKPATELWRVVSWAGYLTKSPNRH